MKPHHCHHYISVLVYLSTIFLESSSGNFASGIGTQNPNIRFDLVYLGYKLVRYQPRHVHLAYDEDPRNMIITWSTIDGTNSSIVEYGDENIAQFQETGTSFLFQSQGDMNLTQWIHRVKLTNLEPGQIYLYHCGSELGWSELYYFRAMRSPNDDSWVPQLAVYGDLGNVNAQTLSRLQRETQLQYYDAILHVGDFAYNLDWENGMVGDSFMDQIQPIAAYVPYMTCPGNHEYLDNFFQYKKRFNMPGKFENMAYSFNMGPVHFVSLSTEFYYFLEYGLEPVVKQYEWLVQDLKEANLPENRSRRPWIITFGHRPMYCSNTEGGDCGREFCRVRNGLPETGWFGLEDLFMKSGVDLTFWAHEHSYERIWPIYNLTVYNGSYQEPYRNPRALVHVITGSAGCDEIHDPFIPDKPDWSAFRSIDYGYTRLKIFNKTHLYLEQLSEDLHGKIIDSFYLIRDKHEPYKIPPTK